MIRKSGESQQSSSVNENRKMPALRRENQERNSRDRQCGETTQLPGSSLDKRRVGSRNSPEQRPTWRDARRSNRSRVDGRKVGGSHGRRGGQANGRLRGVRRRARQREWGPAQLAAQTRGDRIHSGSQRGSGSLQELERILRRSGFAAALTCHRGDADGG